MPRSDGVRHRSSREIRRNTCASPRTSSFTSASSAANALANSGEVLIFARGVQGLGAALVEWVGRRAATLGRCYLRLDCLCGDPEIRRYYEGLGFEHRGDLDDAARGFRLSLYERRIDP